MNSSAHTDTAEMSAFEESRLRFFGSGAPPVRVDAAGTSHPGLARSNNEDHFLISRRVRTRQIIETNLPAEDLPAVEEDAYSLVLADGMGGAAFGELASRLALRTAWELGHRESKWPLKIDPDEAQELLDKLKAYGQLLHEALLERIRREPELKGMGTTFTLAYVIGMDVFIGHVGDSRAYLFRDGSLKCLTRDHTLAQSVLDAGMTIGDPNELKMMSRVLVNCLGGQEGTIYTDVMHLKLQRGDRLLLCTDGLNDMATEADIAAALKANTGSRDACKALTELALAGGGRDNVTIIVAAFETVE